MNIVRFLIGRTFTGIIVLWAAATLTFVMMHLTGGDLAIAILGGPDAQPSAEQIAKVRLDYGLDEPFSTQYGAWLWRLLHGDLGQSYRLRIPVVDAISEQVWPTVELTLAAGALAVGLAVIVALLTANRRPWIGRTISTAELLTISIPSFVTGVGLLLVFAFWLPVLPIASGSGAAGLILPTLTLALPLAAMLSQVMRQELESVLEQPFILTARARGLSDWGVRTRHALRHALLPLVTLSGFIIAGLISGAAVTESLFSRPGMGRLMVDAANSTDIPVVIGVTLLSALLYVVTSIAVDLIGALIDPRSAAA